MLQRWCILPKGTLAGTALRSIQKDTQDSMTMRVAGKYVCSRKKKMCLLRVKWMYRRLYQPADREYYSYTQPCFCATLNFKLTFPAGLSCRAFSVALKQMHGRHLIHLVVLYILTRVTSKVSFLLCTSKTHHFPSPIELCVEGEGGVPVLL